MTEPQARTTLSVGGKDYDIYRLDAIDAQRAARLPFSLKILLENLLRHEDGVNVTREDIEALLNWDPKSEPSVEIAFTPARVVMQDFTGVPAVVDLAAMRDAMAALGGDPRRINPLSPAELVIDHSVQVDAFGTADAAEINARIEFDRNEERYQFLRWGQNAFSNFGVVPPDTGIVHQVNLEYLARVVFSREQDGRTLAYPDTLVGTDSHTTMINGVGVLGWGVGGIEAEAAMLGQPISMLIPQVVGFKLNGRLAEGATATDLVLTVTQMLRARGVVGKFVEFFGDGLAGLPLADRATIGNMAPEYGATCGIFPIDEETLNYLRLSGRDEERVALVEAYAKAQGMWRPDAPQAEYTDVLELDLAEVVPSLAGPKRPQDRIPLVDSKATYAEHLAKMTEGRGADAPQADVELNGERFTLTDGRVVIAAITSCTNTSNPAVMLAAGLVARNAAARGLKVKPWVKTSLAPGSMVVTEYLRSAGLLDDLEALRFNVVGYGCTTCIGNSGPLPAPISQAINQQDLVACSVLSGNRNFEGRVHSDVRMNFLASPPLVVCYALAGTMDIDLYHEPLGQDTEGKDVFLRDLWPSQQEVASCIRENVTAQMFRRSYADVYAGDARWNSLQIPEGERYEWSEQSTYIQNPPYFKDMTMEPPGISDIEGARALALLGDSITTDHISPAGSIKADSPAGRYLIEHGVEPANFNSYGSRRGNHEVMMRGTFANIRLRNQLAPGTEGGWTTYLPTGEQMSIYDAAMKYQADATSLVVLAGAEYGTGSSRDWAAKGTLLLGVKAVIAKSFERIHRSNLVGMGVLPLQFKAGDGASELGLSGTETFRIAGLSRGAREAEVEAADAEGKITRFTVRVRVDTPKEWDYYAHGGILNFVLRDMNTA